MSAKHTPGPWFVSDDGEFIVDPKGPICGCDSLHIPYIGDEDERSCASDFPNEAEALEFEANKNLTAAAPDMYEALQACIGLMMVSGDPAVKMAIDALAKARGEETEGS